MSGDVAGVQRQKVNSAGVSYSETSSDCDYCPARKPGAAADATPLSMSLCE